MNKEMINTELMKIMRAEEEWQRAGSYSVRIQGMNRQHNISLREEFDEHDGDESRYIVVLDSTYPIATCRFYEADPETVIIGRVVVLPEYRGCGIGRLVISEAEKWISELGYRAIEIESRVEAVDFYRKQDYCVVDETAVERACFLCVRMKKLLK